MEIEVFRAGNTPGMQRRGEALEAGLVRGNMGGLVVIKLGPGLELAEHAHEEEHVGAVIEGEFFFTAGEEEKLLRAGDVYRIPPNTPYGVHCPEYALVVQARADFVIERRST